RTPDFVPVLRWLILAAGMVSALSLIWCMVRPVTAGPWRGLTSAAVIGAVIAACAGPLVYSLQTLVTAHTGGIVTAGPTDNAMPRPPRRGPSPGRG
ncbi:glycosyl transferase, partial [Mycobacteroides abscessus subsp. abscessus]